MKTEIVLSSISYIDKVLISFCLRKTLISIFTSGEFFNFVQKIEVDDKIDDNNVDDTFKFLKKNNEKVNWTEIRYKQFAQIKNQLQFFTT